MSPAERSGVVGFKPTRGLIPSEGIIFSSERLDTVGVLTRSVGDAAVMVQEIVRFSQPCVASGKSSRELVNACSVTDLNGIRIGVPSSLAELQGLPEMKQQAFSHALSFLYNAGAEIVFDIEISGAKEYEALSQEAKDIVLDTEMHLALTSYLSSLTKNPQSIHSIADLISFTKTHPKEEYPERNVTVLERVEKAHPDDPLYREMLVKDEYFGEEGGIPGALDRHDLDVLLTPTMSVTLQTFAARSGSPALSVPMGKYPEGMGVERDKRNGFVTVAPEIP